MDNEHILVVKRNTLFPGPDQPWQGLRSVDMGAYLHVVNQEKEFLPRNIMESDPNYKQIIPYLVFEHNKTYFLMQRSAQSSEQRLKNKYSLGIGGHIRQEDMADADIMSWAQREFEEEVSYSGTYTAEPLGILNDECTPVGQVHIGFVFLLKGDSPEISVKSELASGRLVPLTACKELLPHMESWSQAVVKALEARSA